MAATKKTTTPKVLSVKPTNQTVHVPNMNVSEKYYLGPDTALIDPECNPAPEHDNLDGKVDS